eukprot:GHVU01149499.1.p1 GENE.GHVU01149499.1~~GHVU01149499.1.p1  ORF type:complete len:247 (-),score=20.03 GHVU01149499.1:404-1144(-)
MSLGCVYAPCTHRAINPDGVFNADETFLEYNTTSQRSIAAQGSRHVGSLETFREKDGITVMVTVNCMESTLELPMLIFKGKPDANIQKRYTFAQGLHIECNSKHWMNHETMCRWLEILRNQLWLKGYLRVVIIVDSAAQHIHPEVLEFCRDTRGTECEVHIRFILGGLTGIIQPCDVYVNKILKSYIRYVRECACAHMCMCVCVCVHACLCVCTCLCMCACLQMCAHVHVLMGVCVHVCVCACLRA